MKKVFLGGIGSVRSSRFVNSYIVSFIDTLDASQLKKMKRALISEMRLTYNKGNKERYRALKNELDYIKYKLS